MCARIIKKFRNQFTSNKLHNIKVNLPFQFTINELERTTASQSHNMTSNLQVQNFN